MNPATIAWNLRKRVTFKPVSGSVKKLDANTDKNSGDKPNNAMLAPEAIPR
jgi:hypothetical protein